MPKENIADLELAYYRANLDGFIGGIADGRRLYYQDLLGSPETGTAADLQKKYLESLGYKGTVQDMQEQYLIDEGYLGDLTTMQRAFYLTPPLLFGGQVYTYALSAETDPTNSFWTPKPAGYTYYPGEGIGADAPITDMQSMFGGKNTFNDPLISTWDVSTVTNMQSMFSAAKAFNQDISGWNTSAVTNMTSMFSQADAFNQDISPWDTSLVISMPGMFSGTDVFNNGGVALDWANTSSVTNMAYMFRFAIAFNQDISGWDTGSVTDMEAMFESATSFDVDLSGWDVSLIPSEPSNFDLNASSWVLDRPIWGSNAGVFPFSSRAYQYPLSSLTDPTNSYGGYRLTAGYTYYPGEGIATDAPLESMQYMFENTAFNDPLISTWDVSTVLSADFAFQNCDSFNQDLSSWDLSLCENTRRMFLSSLIWNNGGVPLTWTLGSCTNMEGMFNNCPAFNVDVSSWDVSTVNDMVNMFRSCVTFNQDLSGWSVSHIPSEPSNFKTGANAWVLPKPLWGVVVFVENAFIDYSLHSVSLIQPQDNNNKSPMYADDSETFLYTSPGVTNTNQMSYMTFGTARDITTLSTPVSTTMPWNPTTSTWYSSITVADNGLKALFSSWSGADIYTHVMRSGTMSVAHDLSTWTQDGTFGGGVYNPFYHVLTPHYAVTNDSRGMRLYMFHMQQFGNSTYVNTMKLYSFGTDFDLSTLTLVSEFVTTPVLGYYSNDAIRFDVAADGREIYMGNPSGYAPHPTYTMNKVELTDADDLSTMTRDPNDYSGAPMNQNITHNCINMDTVSGGGAFYYSRAGNGYIYRSGGGI